MNKRQQRVRRVSLRNAKLGLHDLYRVPRFVSPPSIFDRRRFSFDPLTRPISERRREARLVVDGKKGWMYDKRPVVARGVRFMMPHKVAICVSRKIRREVLLALGRGGGGNRKPRRNRYSEIGC